MYSMVLMVALTGGVDTIDGHRRGGGCSGGCYGGGYAGCYGGGYGSCYGGSFGAGCSGWLASSSYGCYGGGYASCSGGGHHGRRGGLFGGRHGHRGGGCSGGCYGGGYGGCYGGGYGGGYGGCYGSGYGGAMMGGCYGGAPVMTGPVGPAGTGDTGTTGEDKSKDMPKGEQIGEPKEEEKKGARIAAPGTIIVTLPADARLTVDGVPTRSTSNVRAFATPVLRPGQAYHYTLRAEVTRNGQTVQVERQVPVAAGQTSRVILDIPAAGQRVASR